MLRLCRLMIPDWNSTNRRWYSSTLKYGSLVSELKETYVKQIPAGRFGEPIDIANACVFLASDEASYINGQTIHVNGGMGRF